MPVANHRRLDADGKKVVATVMLALGVWLADRDGQVELLVAPNVLEKGRRVPGLAAPLRGGRISRAFPIAQRRLCKYTQSKAACASQYGNRG